MIGKPPSPRETQLGQAELSAPEFRGYRRRVRIDPHPFHVTAWLEDDFHHFGVDLTHDGTVVTKVVTHAPRYPWTTCPAAGMHLQAQFHMARLASFGAGEDQRQHCTHFYDLAMAAARHALSGEPIAYDIDVDEAAAGGMLAQLRIDGVTALQWRLGAEGERDGIPGGDLAAFVQWTRSLPKDMAEAGLMFRRAVPIFRGRNLDLEEYRTADEVGMAGACYTFQPERAAGSGRILGAIRDFSRNPQDLLKDGPDPTRRSDAADGETD